MKVLKICLVALVTLLCTKESDAQRISRVNQGVDVGAGFSNELFSPSFTYFQNLKLNNFPWLSVGWTGHFSANFLNDYPILESSNTPSPKDVMKFGVIRYGGASFGLTLTATIDKVEIGANVDLVNISVGKVRKALYHVGNLATINPDSVRQYHNTHVDTYPAGIGALPILSSKSNGQNQAFMRFWINDEVGIKVGYALNNVVYRSNEKLNFGQTHFSKRYGMPFIALSFRVPN